MTQKKNPILENRKQKNSKKEFMINEKFHERKIGRALNQM